jgi:pre-mRNA-splicing factor 18
LIEKEKEEYIQKHLSKVVQPSLASTSVSKDEAVPSSKDPHADLMKLPRSEVIRKLRERGEPVMLFGESEFDACGRLRQLEISAPEVNRGFRNDFQEAMEEVDQDYLQEILDDSAAGSSQDKNKNEDIDLDDSVTYESLQEKAALLGRGNKQHDIDVMLSLLKLLLKKWNEQVNCGTIDEKLRTKNKIMKATFTQTRVYLKPLLKKLKNEKIPEDIFDSLTQIIKKLLQRDYIKASDAYLEMAIGNAPWVIICL